MKKALKIFISILVIIFGILLAVPYFFKDEIVATIKESINNNVNAKVDFNNADISLISSFPNAKISLNNFTIITYKPFEGDTLASIKSVSLKLPISSLFKSTSEEINVRYISVEEGNINILVNKKGEANYNIAKESTTDSTSENNEEKSNIKLKLDGYSIEDSNIYYSDASLKVFLKLEDFNHKGSGNFSEAISELKTETSSTISFDYEDTSYLKNNSIQLKADLAMDLNQQKFTFLENEAFINKLQLVFDGFIKLNETYQEFDINFKTPSADFKNFLALIPEKYSTDISDVQTTGNFTIEGHAKGILDETYIPKFNIQLTSNNASFKYPDLPKTINNIAINTTVSNTTGITNDTKINLQNLSFSIDENTFSSSAFISNIIANPNIYARAKGTINLNDISNAYPMEEIKNLQGILKADFETAFDMKSIDLEQYDKTKNAGNMRLSNFTYEGDQTSNPIVINDAQVVFNTQNVDLTNFEATTGKSDLKMNGTVENLVGFVLNNETIKGNFNLNSNTFYVNDFMVTESEPTNKNTSTDKVNEQLKIPSFLDCTINAEAATVIYDNLNLKNVKGKLVIKDEKVELTNLSSEMFNGKMLLNGSVSTKKDTPVFDINMDAQNFDIASSFTQLEMFKAIAPIANLVEGEINTNLKVSGNLNDDLTPNLSTISGNILAELLASKETLQNSQTFSLLSSNLKFLDLNKLNLDNLKASLIFDEGKVTVKPFKLKYEDIDIEISGNHGFDTTMDYNIALDVPAKYLGKDASKLLANLSEQDLNTMSVPVTASVLGTFNNPKINTDMQKAVGNLTQQIIDQQKDKAIDEGVKGLTKLLDDNTTDSDSTKTNNDDIKKAATSVLNNLFGKKKDSTKKQ